MADALRNAPPEAPGEARPPAPFVVGVGRSGTTLLQLMLDAHPELAMPHETGFVPDLIEVAERPGAAPEDLLGVITSHRRWGDYGLEESDLLRRFQSLAPITAGDAVRAFYRAYADRAAKPRWGDKTPGYTLHIRRIARALPEARFIHLIRDGRDVALSQLEVHHGADEVSQAASDWVAGIEKARKASRRLKGYLEVRYEDLVDDPEPVLRQVCELVTLDFDPAMLDYHREAEERMAETIREFDRGQGGGTAITAEQRAAQHANVSKPPQRERAGRWRRDMTPEQLAAFEATAGPLLEDLGYELGGPS
jgi:sulfotransferase family protein